MTSSRSASAYCYSMPWDRSTTIHVISIDIIRRIVNSKSSYQTHHSVLKFQSVAPSVSLLSRCFRFIQSWPVVGVAIASRHYKHIRTGFCFQSQRSHRQNRARIIICQYYGYAGQIQRWLVRLFPPLRLFWLTKVSYKFRQLVRVLFESELIWSRINMKNRGIYGRKFPPSLIPAQDLTYVHRIPILRKFLMTVPLWRHILYAFANLKADTGEVVLSDKWADEDIHYPGDSWNDPPGHHLYGNFKAIYKLKKQHRHLKVLLSIGGWTYSPSFHPIVVNPTLRANFVRSAIQLLEDYGIDGLAFELTISL